MGAAMGDQERIKVDSELYVNEATLELLRRRIESEVKVNFFRSIGLPIGGAGVAAIAFALFFWIPQKVQTFVENDPSVQAALQQSAQGYLTSKEGQEFVRGRIEETARKQVEAEVGAYFTDEMGETLVRTQLEALVQKDPVIRKTLQQSAQGYLSDPEAGQQLIRELVGSYFAQERGQKLVGELVTQNLRSPAVQTLITNAVNQVLQPATAQFSEEIRENMGRLVAEVVLSVEYAEGVEAEDPEIIAKASIEQLHQFLSSPEASELKRKGVPIALSKSTRRGMRYTAGAIYQYIEELQRYFGEQFSMVLILDNDGTFLALLIPEQVQRALDDNLMSLLNAEADQFSTEDARAALADRFGKGCVQFIRTDWSVGEALRRPVWLQPKRLTEKLAVIGADGKFKGTTSRYRLIAGILG